MSLFLYISYLLSANWLLQIYKIKRAKSIASLKLGCLIKIYCCPIKLDNNKNSVLDC